MMSASNAQPLTILAIEPVFADFRHATVNAYLLRALALASGSARIVFAAHPDHYAEVLTAAPGLADRIEFRPIDVVPPGGITFTRFRFHARALLRGVDAVQANCVICLGMTPETLFACGVLRLRHPSLPVIAVLHGHLSHMVGWRSRDPRRRWFDHRSSLRAAAMAGIRFVVLEEYVKRAGLELGLLAGAQCDVWLLPIADGECVASPPPLRTSRLNLGFLGFARPEKGFDNFLALLAQADALGADWYDFSLVGSALASDYSDLPDRLIVVPGVADRTNYVAAVRSVDYACIFLDNDTYRLTSSGSVIDAIAALRPMIGLETSSTRAMFDGHRVGYFCRSMDELRGLIANRDALFDAVRYREFQEGLLALRRGRTPAELAGPIGETIRTVMRR